MSLGFVWCDADFSDATGSGRRVDALPGGATRTVTTRAATETKATRRRSRLDACDRTLLDQPTPGNGKTHIHTLLNINVLPSMTAHGPY
jgi:hypothetical protein